MNEHGWPDDGHDPQDQEPADHDPGYAGEPDPMGAHDDGAWDVPPADHDAASPEDNAPHADHGWSAEDDVTSAEHGPFPEGDIPHTEGASSLDDGVPPAEHGGSWPDDGDHRGHDGHENDVPETATVVGADPDAYPDLDVPGDHGPDDLFPQPVDVGPLPEPVDGFPWTDAAVLGDAGPAEPHVDAVDPHDLAGYAGADLPADPDEAWAALRDSADPATSALARWWGRPA
jgi:hypothetical protein